MTTDPTRSGAWPHARTGRAAVETRFGRHRADLAQWALTTGDPLADDVVSEMHRVGMSRVRKQFGQAAARGIDTVQDAGPALTAFFLAVERIPDYVDDDLLDRGTAAFFTTPIGIHTISLSAGSLLRVYESPSIAFVLAATGRLIEGADRRLQETAKWVLAATLPGALRLGGAGYVATLQVRILHAHMRRLARERGFDEAAHGVAINQVDLARTWMDFTLTPFTAEARLGFDLSAGELAELYRYWWYVGHLLGVDRRLVEGITDHPSARRVDALLQGLTGPAVPESATLAAATIDTVATLLEDQLRLPRRAGVPLLRAVARDIQGPRIADELQIPRSRVAELALPALVAVVRLRRRRARRSPEGWERARRENLAANRRALQDQAAPAAYERGASRAGD